MNETTTITLNAAEIGRTIDALNEIAFNLVGGKPLDEMDYDLYQELKRVENIKGKFQDALRQLEKIAA